MDRMSVSFSKPQLAYLRAEAKRLGIQPVISSGASSISTGQADDLFKEHAGAAFL
jgi:hypothetical protein